MQSTYFALPNINNLIKEYRIYGYMEYLLSNLHFGKHYL